MINEKLRQTLIYNSLKGINTTLDTDAQRDIVNVISALEKKCYDLLIDKVQHRKRKDGGYVFIESILEDLKVSSEFSLAELTLSKIDLICARREEHEIRLVKQVLERLSAQHSL